MNLDEIEKLLTLMERHDLNELQIKEGAWQFSARRGRLADPVVVAPVQLPAAATAAALPAVAALAENLREITAPIVGTFYRSPAPDQAPFKEVGDRVSADDVVCIVEAMKVMNEIRAQVSGKIRKILVENSTAVEYGQPLFLVEIG